jgi:hypothetical protein
MTSAKNLWGDLPDVSSVRTPADMLLEQANELKRMTQGKLIGRVSVSRTPVGVDIEFDVIVPSLANYSVTILRVRHDITLFPATIYRILENNASTRTASIDEFERGLAEALTSPRTRTVVGALIAQAKSF